ncbi:hypothetical protein HP456_00065 [Bacillus haikouensis]|jgi:predicted DNA-binding protein YlxM (UPF0122 family)|uniref:phBC6A51 family helix-turn-helix protein n=1 Tax=Bacillus haikouensis TaxID=1510468 RepID=UPI0015540930|nr:phBC6A51 family helix-turn-helix protein [Bacillus haikouensis]NQD64316.1 hypothetical protein [Bacillus haikouensis]
MKNELAKELTEVQKRVAEELALSPLTGENLSQTAIAEKYEINRRTIWHWRQDPQFIAYQNQVSQMVLDTMTSEITNRLIELIRSKNENVALKSIETYLKLQGRLQGNQNQTNIVIEQPAKATLIDDIESLEKRIAKARAGEPIEVEFEEIDE